MCFYFFSPYKKTVVDYYLQEYFLISYFESLINLDFIITNISDAPLDHLLLISSNDFIKSITPSKKKAIYEYSNFWCASHELRDKSNPFNLIYTSCGNKLIYNKTQDVARIELFNQRMPGVKITREGKVCEGAIEPWVHRDSTPQEVGLQMAVLSQLNWCVLKFTFREQIPPGEDAFIRLRFKPKKHDSQPLEHKFSRYRRFIHFLVLDSLRSGYSVIGPYDIRQAFKSSFELYKNITDKILLINAASTIQKQIIDIYEDDRSCIYFTKMLLHVAPQKYKLLHSFLTSGDINNVGRVPNYYSQFPLPVPKIVKKFPQFSNWRKRVYVWIVNLRKEILKINDDGTLKIEDSNGYFQLNYCGFACNYHLRLCKFILIVFAFLFSFNWIIGAGIQYFPIVDNFLTSFNLEFFSKYPIALPIGIYSLYQLLKSIYRCLRN